MLSEYCTHRDIDMQIGPAIRTESTLYALYCTLSLTRWTFRGSDGDGDGDEPVLLPETWMAINCSIRWYTVDSTNNSHRKRDTRIDTIATGTSNPFTNANKDCNGVCCSHPRSPFISASFLVTQTGIRDSGKKTCSSTSTLGYNSETLISETTQVRGS